MQYGIAVFPPQEIQDFANHFRKRYDPKYITIAPHLTIREADSWTEEQRRAAEAHLEQTAARHKPFGLQFNRFSSFFPASHVVYLATADPSGMQKLYRDICSGPLAEQAKPYAYTPHLTIAQDLTADAMHDVLASVRFKTVDLSFVVDSFSLMEQRNGRWETIRSFPLSG